MPVLSEQITVAEPIVSQATELADERVGPRHFAHGEGERNGHAHRQSLGHRHDDHNHHRHEIIEQLAEDVDRFHPRLRPKDLSFENAAAELGRENKPRRDVADAANHRREFGQLFLQRSRVFGDGQLFLDAPDFALVVVLRRETPSDLAKEGGIADRRHDHHCRAVDDLRAAIEATRLLGAFRGVVGRPGQFADRL